MQRSILGGCCGGRAGPGRAGKGWEGPGRAGQGKDGTIKSSRNASTASPPGQPQAGAGPAEPQRGEDLGFEDFGV